MKKKLWGGRFKKKTHPFMERFSSSISVDRRLAEFDCLGSMAHASMLGKCGIIPASSAARIVKGLKAILAEIKSGRFHFPRGCEDVHTAIQLALYKRIGEDAEMLHTARSRNDQVALDMRMYCRKEIDGIIASLRALKKSIALSAKKNIDVIIPGFTHLQNAQPVLFSHQLMAYCQMLRRDIERMQDCRSRVDVMPLGSCAISGTSLPIDRRYVASRLGFKKVSENSIDSVSDRDFAIEMALALSLAAMHLSRISEDFIILNSPGYGVVEAAEDICTGSSMMPQKKNPDALELVRGMTGEVYGALFSLLTMMKGLPLSYNRDMQQDKAPLFRAIDTVKDCLDIMKVFFNGLRINRERAAGLLKDEGLYATDIMEYLVKKGVPLGDAHKAVGRLIRYCLKNKLKIAEVPLNHLRSIHKSFDRSVYDLIEPEISVNLKVSSGSTSPSEVKKRIKNA